jgi:hypothetical protein
VNPPPNTISVPPWKKSLLITTINEYLHYWETIPTAVLDCTSASFCLIPSSMLLLWLAQDLQLCLAIIAQPKQI